MSPPRRCTGTRTDPQLAGDVVAVHVVDSAVGMSRRTAGAVERVVSAALAEGDRCGPQMHHLAIRTLGRADEAEAPQDPAGPEAIVETW